jgi:hypothetical protein
VDGFALHGAGGVEEKNAGAAGFGVLGELSASKGNLFEGVVQSGLRKLDARGRDLVVTTDVGKRQGGGIGERIRKGFTTESTEGTEKEWERA